jgi:hypothetical protein
MPIFHKIIFKHIFHKRESLYMLPKGTFIWQIYTESANPIGAALACFLFVFVFVFGFLAT